MDEYIKKADVLEYLSARKNQVLKSPLSTLDAKFEVMEIFDFVTHRVESTDVAPVRHGRWAIDEFGHYCTACREYAEEVENGEGQLKPLTTPYCPNCGCIMDLED